MGSQGRGRVKKVLGATAEGLPDTPKKMSNVKLSRLAHGEERGCSRCFPHGPETNNSTRNQNRRSWKNNRKTKYRPKKAGKGALMEKHYDVILIYNSGDSKRAEELVKVLSDAGLAVWFDKWNLVPGDSWAATMAKAMSSSRYVIVLIGASSYGAWVQHEYRPAIHKTVDRDFRLVPVLLPGSRPENIPLMLSIYSFYDRRDWSQDKLQQFALLILRTDRAGAGTDPKPRVFLCHAKEDAEHVEDL